MSPSAKFFNAIFFLLAAGSIVAIGTTDLHRRYAKRAERTDESRRIIEELAPMKAESERASYRWQDKVSGGTAASESKQAEDIQQNLEREDRSEFSKFMDRVKPW